MKQPEIKIENLNFQFDELKIFDNLNLEVASESTFFILGKSGLGKTTLLFLIAGLLKPNSGSIKFAKSNPHFAFVFQDLRLIPWLTAKENITYIMNKKIKKEEANQTALKHIDAVGLSDFENYYPSELSGGMNRRLCLARAMASDADIFLLDEAFSSLDKKTKITTCDVFKNYIKENKKTAICVTHDTEITPLIADNIIEL